MNKATLIWTLLFILGAVGLVINTATRGAGKAYVKQVPVEYINVSEDPDNPRWVEVRSEAALDYDLSQFPEDERIRWNRYESAEPRDYAQAMADDPNQTEYYLSWRRTIGVWVAALFTLFIFSFLYKDNPLYKIAEASVVGVSAAYWMVVAFHDVLIPNLLGKLAPEWVKQWAIPGLENEANYWYIGPLILSILLLWRLAPKGAWIARWPLAFIIGTTAGIRLLGFIHGDFLSQIRNTIVSLYVVTDGAFDWWESVRNLILLIGVISALVYFFFSFEHKGIVGKTARLGIWFLMITFGAAFGYTVMGRIALLAIRLEFLVDDWLWLIDPLGRRAADTAAMIMPLLM